MHKKPTALGIYIFAGLFTQGVKDAGFDVVAHFEDGKFGTDTSRINHPEVKIYDNAAEWPVLAYRDQVDFVFSNAACAGFSCMNCNRGVDNESNSGLNNSNFVARQLRPKVYMVESVAPLFDLGLPLVEQWEKDWAALGYKTCRLLENAAHLGVPQQRRRAVFVAARADIDFSYLASYARATTVRDTISDLWSVPEGSTKYVCQQPQPKGVNAPSVPPLTPYQVWLRDNGDTLTQHEAIPIPARLGTLVPHIPPDKRCEHVPEEIYYQTYWKEKKGGKPGVMYRRLAWDKHCSVLPGAACCFHPEYNRFLTVREHARMMGVRDSFKFSSVKGAYAEIGKAVSPVVGFWLASHAMEFIENPNGRDHRPEVDLVHIKKDPQSELTPQRPYFEHSLF